MVNKMLDKDPAQRPTLDEILNTPFVKECTGKFSEETLKTWDTSRAFFDKSFGKFSRKYTDLATIDMETDGENEKAASWDAANVRPYDP